MVESLFHRIRRRTEKSADWFRGWCFACVVLKIHRILRRPIRNLNRFERRIPFIERREYAQNREDGIINAIFDMMGTTDKTYVEFGVEDGMECNTRYLMKHRKWKGLLMDGNREDYSINLHREFVTAENVEELFRKYNVPASFDLLSIDIDGNDYWVWKAITHYRPRVVIIEYNACIPYAPAVTIPYQQDFVWDKTDYYGASLSALVELGNAKGYTLVATDSHGVNAFFVLSEIAKGSFVEGNSAALYRPAAFKGKEGNRHPHDPHDRPWVQI
jgi:hypothetical protein